MPGSTVVDPKIVREVGTHLQRLLIRRAPTFVFSTSTVGDEPHRDRFLQRRQLHRRVDGDRLPDRHDDVVAHQRRKARELERERVGAGRDRGKAVDAAIVRHRRRRAHDGRAGQRDGDAGQHGSLVVGNLAYELAEVLAGLGEGDGTGQT